MDVDSNNKTLWKHNGYKAKELYFYNDFIRLWDAALKISDLFSVGEEVT